MGVGATVVLQGEGQSLGCVQHRLQRRLMPADGAGRAICLG